MTIRAANFALCNFGYEILNGGSGIRHKANCRTFFAPDMIEFQDEDVVLVAVDTWML
jgi:hypothetical protein